MRFSVFLDEARIFYIIIFHIFPYIYLVLCNCIYIIVVSENYFAVALCISFIYSRVPNQLMILIYITNKDMEEAKKVASHLIAKKLIACANIFPVASLYNWKGKLQDDQEAVLICKTKDELYNEIVKEVKKIHSYEVPCVLRINAKANKEYNDWVFREVKKP